MAGGTGPVEDFLECVLRIGLDVALESVVFVDAKLAVRDPLVTLHQRPPMESSQLFLGGPRGGRKALNFSNGSRAT